MGFEQVHGARHNYYRCRRGQIYRSVFTCSDWKDVGQLPLDCLERFTGF